MGRFCKLYILNLLSLKSQSKGLHDMLVCRKIVSSSSGLRRLKEWLKTSFSNTLIHKWCFDQNHILQLSAAHTFAYKTKILLAILATEFPIPIYSSEIYNYHDRGTNNRSMVGSIPCTSSKMRGSQCRWGYEDVWWYGYQTRTCRISTCRCEKDWLGGTIPNPAYKSKHIQLIRYKGRNHQDFS